MDLLKWTFIFYDKHGKKLRRPNDKDKYRISVSDSTVKIRYGLMTNKVKHF